jgi:3-hydroxybutyryl-CoA dehydrogenase
MAEELPHVCVIGAGTMGRGIAQVAVGAGHLVSLVDPDGRQLDAAVEEITRRIDRRDPGLAQLLGDRLLTARAITGTHPWPGTVVIEAVVEDLAVKQRVLGDAARHFGSATVLATNTSSLSVTNIAAGIPAPSRVVGMHFFNPVPAMRLVEVVNGLQTDPAVVDAVDRLATSWGKHVARVRSTPGFIVNRVARAFYGEALRLVEEQVTTPEMIDELMRSAGHFRMGPFELMDLIGVEVNLEVTRTVWKAYNYDARFAPSLIQSELVAAGRLGRKSGYGFYRYGDDIERPSAEPCRAVGDVPDAATLHGRDAQLETLLTRAGVNYDTAELDGSPWLELPGIGAVVVTRGRTAREEAGLRPLPAVVVDRCIDPTRVAGLAFAPTDDAVADAVVALLDRAGVRSYRIADRPGLVLCRVLCMIANEAWETVHQGVAAREDIDAAMVLGTSYPMGPFAWCGEWGHGAVLETLDALWAEYHDPRYRASQRLRASVRAALSLSAG